MEPEIIQPDNTPKISAQALSPVGFVLAALGATLLTFCLLGSAAVASVWAFSKMLGFPDLMIEILMAVIAIPVLMATFWTAGRAWHVEQRLARGLDVDTPVFSTTYYWHKNS